MPIERVRLTVVGLACWAWTAMAGAQPLPVDLAGYRSWTALTPEPERVPWQLAFMCRSPSPEMVAEARKSHGPHTDRWVKVYANPKALRTLRETLAGPYPAGSILAKEKLRHPGDEHPEGTAFMVKRPEGAFPESGGWEFLFFPHGKTPRYDGCVACHRSPGARDYVFSSDQAPPRSR